MQLSKSEQDNLKDVGGFVGGTLSHPRRKPSNVTGRDLITLDLDSLPANSTNDILDRITQLQCAAVIYSTRKHCANRPRLRVIIPTDRTMTADEYEPAARKVAELIGIAYADPTTFEVARLMYGRHAAATVGMSISSMIILSPALIASCLCTLTGMISLPGLRCLGMS